MAVEHKGLRKHLLQAALYEAIMLSGDRPPSFVQVTEALEDAARGKWGTEWEQQLQEVGLSDVRRLRRMLPAWIN